MKNNNPDRGHQTFNRRGHTGCVFMLCLVVFFIVLPISIFENKKTREQTTVDHKAFVESTGTKGELLTVNEGGKLVLPVAHDLFFEGMDSIGDLSGRIYLVAYPQKNLGQVPEREVYRGYVKKVYDENGGYKLYGTIDLRKICSAQVVLYVHEADDKKMVYCFEDVRENQENKPAPAGVSVEQ